MISNVQLKEDDAVYECQVTATATAEGLRSRKAQLTVLCEYSRSCILLPTGSEERGVWGSGSISVAIPPSSQDMKTIAL